MYLLLSAAVVPSSLPHVEQPRVGANQLQHVVGHQPVVEQQIGALDDPDRLQGQQLGIPGPRAHQVDVPGPALPAAASALPLVLEHPEQVLQLRQLEGDVVPPERVEVIGGGGGGGAGGGGERGLAGGAAVEPPVAAVPLRRVLLGERRG